MNSFIINQKCYQFGQFIFRIEKEKTKSILYEIIKQCDIQWYQFKIPSTGR